MNVVIVTILLLYYTESLSENFTANPVEININHQGTILWAQQWVAEALGFNFLWSLQDQ